jgi:hypothetical protein
LGGAVGEHAGGFQATLLETGEVPPPGIGLDWLGGCLGYCRTHAIQRASTICGYQAIQ